MGYQEHVWRAEPDGLHGRARVAAASRQYLSTLTPSIAQYVPSLPTDLVADAEEATAALARFDTYARSVLGADSPTLGPMSSILLRTESTSSSQIENLTVGARQLALAEIDQSTSQNAKVVVANVRAMEAALELAERLDADAILTMQHELLEAQPGFEDHASRYRDALVWVGSSALHLSHPDRSRRRCRRSTLSSRQASARRHSESASARQLARIGVSTTPIEPDPRADALPAQP
ncbi:hypothetical protein HGK34_08770 [Myceligenerans sp. I2]|uniref:Fic/DOC N-terminal domain-containing protein n=2 Tax=Myceligenerans indicum TaxID=2593663 RepID=A0ABS1LJF4_9MICO|nr:hypothetical protein [Myceligenerans indicum]